MHPAPVHRLNYLILMYMGMQADHVRAHWAWRRIAYPGGHVPASNKQQSTQLSSTPYTGDSKDAARANGDKNMGTYNPTFDSARGQNAAHANGLNTVGPDAVSRGNAA